MTPYEAEQEERAIISYDELVEKNYSGTINGNITGENDTFNTLKLNNEGDLTVSGKEISVYNITNDGTINSTIDKVEENL